MSKNKDNFSIESHRYAESVAEDINKKYMNDRGDFKQKSINNVISNIANEGFDSDIGRIKTTLHNEKVILDIDGIRRDTDLGRYGIPINRYVLSLENYPEEERISLIKDWIINKSEEVRRKAISIMKDNNNN